MNDRSRWDEPRGERGREDYSRGGSQGHYGDDSHGRQQQQDWGGRPSRQQGAWPHEDYRRPGDYSGNEWRGGRDWGSPSYGSGSSGQPQQREWRGSQGSNRGGDYGGGDPMSQGDYGYAERAWGGSSERQGMGSNRSGSRQRDEMGRSEMSRGEMSRGEMGGGSSYSGESTRLRQDRDLRGQNRQEWYSQDSGRAGSQGFASGYGMESGANYDQWGGPQRREFGHAGGSNPTFGRGYGPDYLHGRGGDDHDEHAGRQGGSQERGFFERAGDEIASWFGDEDAARRREQDYRGHGPSDYTRSDERIREDVNDRLTDDPRLDARKISVQVKEGEVTLSGTVGSREAKRRAEDTIDRISGVRHVQNNLRVEERGRQGSESWSSGSTSTGTATGATAGSTTTGSTMGSATGTTTGTTMGSGSSSATGSGTATPGTTGASSGGSTSTSTIGSGSTTGASKT